MLHKNFMSKTKIRFVAHWIMLLLVSITSQMVNYSSRTCTHWAFEDSIKSTILTFLKQNQWRTRTFFNLHMISAARIIDRFGHTIHQKKRNWMSYEVFLFKWMRIRYVLPEFHACFALKYVEFWQKMKLFRTRYRKA